MIDPLLAAIIGFALLFVFLLTGMPICIGLGLAGMLGVFLIEGGFSGAVLGIADIVLRQLWSPTLLALPLFIFMGYIVTYHGIGTDLYDASYKWLARLPGGLAIVSTIVSALFGFMCGSGMAGTATIGALAIPEMERRKYDRKLALGTLAVAGGLSALIPPSVLMIVYAGFSETSLGWLFLAGIIPGLLFAALMCIYIFTRAILDPNLCPLGQLVSMRDKVKSLVKVLPSALLAVSILGGIFMGIWSPIEAGAGGSIVALLIAAAYRRVGWTSIKKATFRTAGTSIMLFMVIIGASIVAYLFYLSGFEQVIIQFFSGLLVPGWVIILIMMFVMMILGMFMDPAPIILITLPFALPTIVGLGYHPVWWGVMCLFSGEMSVITPPVGLHLFVIHGIAPRGTTMVDIIRGVIPFLFLEWSMIGLLIAFPGLAMWLPTISMTKG